MKNIKLQLVLASLVLGGIVSCSGAFILLGLRPALWGQELPLLVEDGDLALSPEKRRTIQGSAVKVITGEFWGSGVIVVRRDNDYHVLTNDHVLDPKTDRCQVQTVDKKQYPCQILARRAAFNGSDLALIRFTGDVVYYRTATFAQLPSPGETVYAVGFPVPTPDQPNPRLTIELGRVWRRLDKPLAEGYQLGYDSAVSKGMSGGAVVDDRGDVVAVNGMNAYPLLGQGYVYEDGTQPDAALMAEMQAYSFGIPAERIPPWIFNVQRLAPAPQTPDS